MSVARLTVVVVLFASTAIVARSAPSADRAMVSNLSALSYTIGDWTGADDKALDAETVSELGADAYLTRNYFQGGGAPIGVYIAFYGAQRPGVSVHSPLHCLPGTGWEPLDVGTIGIASDRTAEARVRRLVVRKNRDRAVVLYWYAIHGRVIANEAASKLWLLHDSIRFGRSDAALVRVVVPITGVSAGAASDAERRGVAFTRDLLPYLAQLWS
jgi:EpsI family protein